MNPRFSDALREASEPDWSAGVAHRFVRELGEGSVAPGVMASYLVQDHRFLDDFLGLLGAAIASADTFDARLRLGRFAGTIAGEENTYFLRAFEALGIDAERRIGEPDKAATRGFRALMREAAQAGSYPCAIAVLTVAEWLYLEWARRCPYPRPPHFLHAEWITLHDNAEFGEFVSFLRAELDRVGPSQAVRVGEFFTRAVRLERAFFDAAYEG
ncbi:TenA family protein [Aureimonas phyllosphaerae]|uniref:Aminopyrimidine aminohydrolase n=1 Tax=Aureimonas phyllosphaerae TaxID=1166078 RepID=A0A7W6BSH6_9HYPH|nr:TenA family protein [Aureimonas phyllosphaerae]MBB3933895.1 thiaminase/transcriptional activator TenA [Aureimonas phyllosphaerae]MBB3958889.1 thiaminase/transcriptional activator TenA [Aureimonas phyllosphaerae]SFF20690.1 thiaminase (transcriptional activator TenA) [Aureimonas phyllosphaerae]